MTYWGENVAFRDSYPGALVLMRHFVKLHSYIGALGLYENVCLLKVTLSVVGITLR